MPTAKKPSTRGRSKATDSRVWVTEIPTSGEVGAYVLAAETDSTGAVLNNFSVIEAPEGEATEAFDTPGWVVKKTGLTLGDALRFIAGRVDLDLKGMATEPSPATVTPIKKTAAKKAPATKKKGLTKAAAVRPAKRTPGAAKAPAKKASARRRSPSGRSRPAAS